MARHERLCTQILTVTPYLHAVADELIPMKAEKGGRAGQPHRTYDHVTGGGYACAANGV